MKITLYLCVAVFHRTQKDRPDHLSVDSLKEKERRKKKGSLPDVFSLSLSFFHEVLSVPAIPLSAFH